MGRSLDFVDHDALVPARYAGAHRLAKSVIERVASTESPQPVMAIVERRTQVLNQARHWVVVADQVADPGNLGTIMRSAEAAGAAQVVLTPGSVDAFNPKAVRSSAGALFHVGVVEGLDLGAVREAGYRLIGTTSRTDIRAQDYRTVDLRGSIALVVGNEAHGLDAASPIDTWITVPHLGRSESLNVAMAATVLCFAVANQHDPLTSGE